MLIQSLPIENPSQTDTGLDSRNAAPGDGLRGDASFSNRFVSAMEAIASGQNLAAGALTLRTQALGPHLELVTSQADQPDSASLAAFAKAQGLDPQVVAWLFGPAADVSSKVRSVEGEGVDAADGAWPAAGTDGLLSSGLGLPPVPPTWVHAQPTVGYPGTGDNSLAPAKAPSVQVSITAVSAEAAPFVSPDGTATQSAIGSQVAGASPLLPEAWPRSQAAGGAATGQGALAAGANGATSSRGATVSAPAGAVLPPLNVAGAPVVAAAVHMPEGSGGPPPLAATAGAGLVWALAMAEGRGREDTAAASASDTGNPGISGLRPGAGLPSQAQPGAVSAPAPDPASASNTAASTNSARALPVEAISLEISPELEQALSRPENFEPPTAGAGAPGETPLGGMAGRDGPQAPSGTTGARPADTPTSAPGPRPQGFQELAEKLGQEVGQRLISQIQKGNWQIRLTLRPVTLGEVEVDLRMRAGELDAAFRSINPATRELLNEGLPRLRETLGNAGMDIAGLHVGVGQQHRNGGNSTPQQAIVSAGANGTQASPMIEDAAQVRTDRRPAQGQGWDVLV